MAQVEILLPKMGESVTEATIVEWLKEEGEHIEEDEFIVNIATDKVDNEVPSEYAGKLVKKLFSDGDVVKVGEAFAIIETDKDVEAPEATAIVEEMQVETDVVEETQINETEVELQEEIPVLKNDESGRFYSPLVRNIAKSEGLGMVELSGVPGTGLNQRVTKKDILDYLKNRDNQPVAVKKLEVTQQTNNQVKKSEPPAITLTTHQARTAPQTHWL